MTYRLLHLFLFFFFSSAIYAGEWINYGTGVCFGSSFTANLYYEDCLVVHTTCRITSDNCPSGYERVQYFLDNGCNSGDKKYLSTPSTASNIDDFDLSLAPFNACSDDGCSATATKSYRVSETHWEHEYEISGSSCDGSSSSAISVSGTSSDTLPSSESTVVDNSDPNQPVTTTDSSEVVYNADGSTTTVRNETTTTTLQDGSTVEETTTTTTVDNTNNGGGTSITSTTTRTDTDSQGQSTTQITGTFTSNDTGQEHKEEDFGYGTGTASGNCDSPPACSDGDPQLCAILNQQWHTMCAGELVTPSSFESQLQAEGLTDPGPSQSVFDSSNTFDVNSDVQAALNDIETTFNPGSCPLTNEQVSFFSETLTIDVSHVCDFIPLLAAIIRTMAGVSACWILLSGLTGASRT